MKFWKTEKQDPKRGSTGRRRIFQRPKASQTMKREIYVRTFAIFTLRSTGAYPLFPSPWPDEPFTISLAPFFVFRSDKKSSEQKV